MVYVRHIAAECLRRGWRVKLVTTQAACSEPAVHDLLTSCHGIVVSPALDSVPFPRNATVLEVVKYQVREFRNFRAAHRKIIGRDSVDFVYCVNFDYFDKVMALVGTPFGSTPFGGMLMRIRFHHRQCGVVSPGGAGEMTNRMLFHQMLNIPSLKLLTTCDELLRVGINSWKSLVSKVRFVPEMATVLEGPSREVSRRSLDVPSGRFVVLVYGALSGRKGVSQLLAAAARSECPERVTVLLAGTADPVLAPVLDGPDARMLRVAGRLKERFGFQTSVAESQLFAAADAVWMGYRGHYTMSGVLVQAAAIGLPVISCAEGLIGWWTRKYSAGEIVDIDSTESVLNAIRRLVCEGTTPERYRANARNIARLHGPQAFASTICDAIGENAPCRRGVAAGMEAA